MHECTEDNVGTDRSRRTLVAYCLVLDSSFFFLSIFSLYRFRQYEHLKFACV